jgi:hypothetical protein
VTWEGSSEETGQWLPEETIPLHWQAAFPPKTPVAVRRKIELQHWRKVTHDVWLNLPLAGLQGRTPREAASDPTAHMQLLAAVYVLDAQCLRGGHQLDMHGLLMQLGVEPLPNVTVTPETSLNAFTPLQWLRLPLNNLSDEQMLSAVNRALLVHHDRFLYDALRAAIDRPKCLEELDVDRVYQTLADLCRKHNRRDESFQWLDAGRKHAQSEPNNFEKVWSWDLRELLARVEDPGDPGIKPLLDKFVNYYAPKLPQIRPYLEEILAVAGLESPWSSTIITADSATAAGGGLWTPEGAAAQPAAAGKLWLPGS